MPYTLNLHSDVCQLFFETRKKKAGFGGSSVMSGAVLKSWRCLIEVQTLTPQRDGPPDCGLPG